MGVVEFYNKFEPSFSRFCQKKAPTGEDKDNIAAALDEIETEPELNLDKTARENYYRALGLSTLWINQRIVDPDLHIFLTNTLSSYGNGKVLGPKNEFFYKETTHSCTQGLFRNSRAEIWFDKGEECLFMSGVFRESLQRPRQLPGLSETRYAGQQAFLFAADLYQRHHSVHASQRAHLAINIWQHYKELESSLHEIAQNHVFRN